MRKFIVAGVVATAICMAFAGCAKKEASKADANAPKTQESAESKDNTADSQSDSSKETADDSQKDDSQEVLTLAAAASLEYAFSEKIIPAFEKANPDIKVEATYDASGKLQTQIESGLEADIFFSAAQKQMNALDEEGMIDSESIKNLLENKIVLIAPASAENSEIKTFEDIEKAKSIAVGDPESVPVGQYSKEALTNLKLWDKIQDKVSLGTNVTEVLNWVAESSAECGIVYATDAATTDKVKVVAEAPEGSLAKPVVYPVAKLKNAKDKASKLLDYICSDESVAVFKEYGFADNR